MKIALALVTILSFAACSKNKGSSSTEPATGTTSTASTGSGDDAEVDPTLPSWTPKSCIGYHRATVKLTGCEAMPQAERDAMTKEYEARHAEWKALQNAEAAQFKAIDEQCQASLADLHQKANAANCTH